MTLSPERHADLLSRIQADPEARVAVDLTSQTVTFPDGTTESFHVDAFSRHCMLNGLDSMGHLLEFLPAIQSFESGRPTWATIDTSPLKPEQP